MCNLPVYFYCLIIFDPFTRFLWEKKRNLYMQIEERNNIQLCYY